MDALNDALNVKVFGADYNYVTEDLVEGLDVDNLAEMVAEHAVVKYNDKCNQHKAEGFDFGILERAILLKVVDTLWMECTLTT